MFKVSGPVAVYALKIKDKNIILFGDNHENKDNLCKTCDSNCLYITDLLLRLKPKSEMFIESFIYSEYWYSQRKAKPNNVLEDVIKVFHSKMHTHKGKPTKGVKVHYSDIRSLDNFSPFDDLTEYIMLRFINGKQHEEIQHLDTFDIIRWCESSSGLKTFIDIMLKSDDYIFDVSTIIPIRIRKHFTYKHDLMLHQRRYVTRLRKQMLKLQDSHQRLLLEFHEDRCNQLIKEHKAYDVLMTKIHLNQKITDNDVIGFGHALLDWGCHIKDLYTLARMLFYVNKSDNIVSYDGAFHTKVYADFFKKYMKASLTYKDNHITQRTRAGYLKLKRHIDYRCVSVPQKIISTVFDV
jgi:hypothetical protein